MIKIYGKVTDFEGNPVEEATVVIVSKEFEVLYQTFSDADGKYNLNVNEGNYIALWACKDYAVKNLEYWAWNIPAYQDLEVNPRINGLEVYAVNAWMPQGGLPSMQIYFRPMSLKRSKEFSQRLGIGFPPSADEIRNVSNNFSIIDIAPNLTKGDIEVIIDNQTVKVLEINKVKEAAGGNQSIYGYLIQTALPVNSKTSRNSGYSQIRIIISDRETGEKGEGCLFCKRIWEMNNWM
ncbi:carboxypeptidase regulatory-like domain-containing protein [Candidatus Bathyarchaeota archaeon]|nr:carboxypeptidase regulatory-like domain-containing protein [Candidatus Bathyarchaeota archaeon]